jgi:5'-3' exonuclease
MGIPLFFKIISEKYTSPILNIDDVDGVKSLFIDMNCLIHPCCRNLLDMDYSYYKRAQYETRMFHEIENYLRKIVELTDAKFIYIAVDGVAPCSKMNQQRLRRFKSILERKENNKIKGQLSMPIEKEYWDTNCISPGTEFMASLSTHITNLIMDSDIFTNRKVIYSDHLLPGEGEHKILAYIRSHELDGNSVIYGLDADLIMLGLASNKNNIYLLREAMAFGKPTEDFLYLDIDCLKCGILEDFKERYSVHNRVLKDTMLINIINDYIFICFFLGNDFLPHILGLDLRYQGLDIMLDIYTEAFSLLNSNIIQDNKINMDFLTIFLSKLKDKEPKFISVLFKKRQSLNKFFKVNESNEYDRRIALLNNYPILNMDDEKYVMNDNSHMKSWKNRYYKKTLGSIEKDDINAVCKNYIDGLVWVFRYYMVGCDSWHWKYNYNDGPLLSDLADYVANMTDDINKIKFPKTEPVNPYVQLLSILPEESSNLLPIEYRKIFKDSNISYLYPIEYKLDTIFKRYYWQCVPVLPHLNIKEVIKEFKKIKCSKPLHTGTLIHKAA